MTGDLRGPDGAAGTFTGTYRLERLVDQSGQIAAVGVFAGKLTTAGGGHLGMGSRRLTAAAELRSTPDAFCARIGPLDVVILGFDVAVAEFTVAVPRKPSHPTPLDPQVTGDPLARNVASAAAEESS